MKSFLIAGCIVDDDSQRWSYEDVTPTQVNSFIGNLQKGEELHFEITSPGGSCTAGLAIANMIKKCSAEGHHTVAHVIGLAASMASVIACACDELQVDSTSFLMVHNPWSSVQGNASELRKEAETLDKFKAALVSIYKTKFEMDAEGIGKLMDEETWIVGEQASIYSLRCNVIPVTEPLKACASMKHTPTFATYAKIPTNLKDLIEGQQMNKEQEEIEPKAQSPQDMITVEEADKRVSGMQSTMAKQLDALRKDFEAKIQNLEVQLRDKEAELTNAKAEVINLNQSLDSAKDELQKTASALADKQKALETLNANVNTPTEELPTFQDGLAKCKTPSERVAFISSGKYTK